MKFSIILFVLSTVILSALCTSYIFGEKTENSRVALRRKVKYEAIPFRKRITNFSYNSSLPIQAIKCVDYQNSDASVNVTDGGIGYNYVELRMKSQKSYRLEYFIEIYV